jgi:hypothetical protein
MEFTSNNHSNGNGKPKTIQDLVTANVHFLIEQLEGGHSEVLTQYLSAMARFHTYSFGNILLIARQKPTATRVAGIRAWNELRRRVTRGEKGIQIFAPLIGYKRNQSAPEAEAQSRKAEKNAPPEAKTDAVKPHLIGFRAVHVFDVAQTEGEPLAGNMGWFFSAWHCCTMTRSPSTSTTIILTMKTRTPIQSTSALSISRVRLPLYFCL